MLRLLLWLGFCFILTTGTAQAIDGSIPFDTDPDKKYSLYIPSTYDADEPIAMMLGLHPFNVDRWDAAAWRDTLIAFAETNALLLVCPDGGLDGRVDDSIDTAFTSVLVDSVAHWYNIDPDQKYMMGFSWGGKTTYSYGLKRTSEYKGYLVIGAAAGLQEIASVLTNAKEQPFYLVHGSLDQVNTRYTPFIETLPLFGACVESQLLDGVGHTIDFANRNDILSEAYNWLKEANCELSSTEDLTSKLSVTPNPTSGTITLDGFDLHEAQITLTDLAGRKIPFTVNGKQLFVSSAFHGTMVLQVIKDQQKFTKLVIKL